MSKAEIDQRIAVREIGPVGQLLLESGTIHDLLREKEDSWVSGHYVMSVSAILVNVSNVIPAELSVADTDVRYSLAAPFSWSPVTYSGHRSQDVDILTAGVYRCAKAA
jgi:hypothetical protein